METSSALTVLAALAHETRLDVFRALVRAGEPVPAGRLSEVLGVPASTLSFHLKELRWAGVVRSERQGRSQLYSADYSKMKDLCSFLMKDCCGGLS